ncbi:hemerythrin domain-containing protein [Streptomyces thermospinosisporus]|uniref:hemerythrin domain-containing protein n=1 Tax=Streptomyces thermospinosisporus TaxID=161482 RepID=UPI0031DF1B79
MTVSIEEQTVEQLGGPASVLARQRRDHAEMDRLMDRWGALADGEERERVLKEIVQLVFSHAFAEETVLWPAVRRSVQGGDELTSLVEEEHQEINDLVARIERLSPGSSEREEKVRRVFALIRQDIRDEEDVVLPRLQESLPAAQLRRLGTAWDTVRRSAPTHPHPVIPRRPPGNALLGVPLSAYDRIRDAVGAGKARSRSSGTAGGTGDAETRQRRQKRLEIFLNDHLAGAAAAAELARRMVQEHGDGRYGDTLRDIARQCGQDRLALQRQLGELGIPVKHYKVYGAWLGEKAGRLKPNGRLLRGSGLSLLVELGVLRLAAQGKALCWRALLAAARRDTRLDAARLEELLRRAERQMETLDALHDEAAGALLADAAAAGHGA